MLPHDIWPELFQLERNLEFWITTKSFAEQELASRFHERIEAIHPFANGNGRFGRIITEQICRFQSFAIPTWGHTLHYNPTERRAAYIQALTFARRKADYSSLVEIMFR